MSLAVPTRRRGALPHLDLGEGDSELRVERVLGRGGMGQVQLARQRSLDRDVAVKRPLPDRRSPMAVQALLREGFVTGQLEHPNIVPVHMLGTDERGDPVVVMKRVEGVPWSELIDDPQHPAWHGVRTLSREPVLRHVEILLPVCMAVRFAHARGFVHRDIKPANVMIGSFGEIYVLDWGVAARIGTSAYAHAPESAEALPLGTPAYMAPEMLQSDGVIDERTDVYLLAATLHRALTGRPRHQGDDVSEVFQSALSSVAYEYSPDVPALLADICNRAMAPRPLDRYRSVDELAAALAEFLRHQGSMRLCDEAEARLRELDACLLVPGAPLEGPQKLFSESRFGFEQALREWPANERAARGLHRAIAVMACAMLARDNIETAEALAAELPQPAGELDAALVAARERRAVEREYVHSLRKLAHDVDADVAIRPRFVLFISFGLVGGLIAIATLLFGMRTPLSYPKGLGILAGLGTIFTALLLVGRRRVLRNSANRRIVAIVYVSLAASFLHRLFGMWTEVPLAHVLPGDLLMWALGASTAAIAVDRRMTLLAVIFAVGAVTAHALMDHVVIVFLVTATLACVLGPLPWLWRSRHRQAS